MTGLKPLIDGDILRYEIGFGAETGWKKMTNDPEAIPPFYYVEEMLRMRLANISALVHTKETPTIFITEGDTFRNTIAKTKPYKGTRKDHKPWHFRNLTAYMKGVLNATVVHGIEADDLMAIEHTSSGGRTIICSRDKDLKQIPGWLYSWELGAQPSFGPDRITKEGSIALDRTGKTPKIKGTGLLWFYAQVLTGDVTDNIPGLSGCGPVDAYDILTSDTMSMGEQFSLLHRVEDAYIAKYGEDGYEERLLEQGQLCWIVRRFDADGKPELWKPGLEE